MIELRLCVARSEARFGSCSEAEKHLDVARALLGDYPNLWLAGTIELDQSNIAALRGDIDRSLRHVELALELAEQSGHFRTRMAALINSSQLLGCRGKFDSAHDRLNEVTGKTNCHRQLTLAALDSRANLLVTSGDLEAAVSVLKDLLAVSQPMGETRLHWDRLTESYTRARIAAAVGDWLDAERQLGPALVLARECHDRIWSRRLDLLLVKCRAKNGHAGLDDAVFDAIEEANIEALAQRYGSLSAVLGSSKKGNASLIRAIRVAEGIGNSSLRRDVTVGMPTPTDLPAGSHIDDAVALLEFAAYPQILAREAFSVLVASECVQSAALVSRGDHAIDVIEHVGWNAHEAIRAAESSDDHQTICCGTYRDQSHEIVATRPYGSERG